jgi:FeS assembly SUF system protein
MPDNEASTKPADEPVKADASAPASPQEAPNAPTITGGDEPLRERIVGAIRNVFDPEIPVNIYELGLIYGIDIDEGHNVNVKMTLTSPACPAAQDLPLQVRGTIAVLPGVNEVDVDVVFDPPWSPQKMSDEAKVALGMM